MTLEEPAPGCLSLVNGLWWTGTGTIVRREGSLDRKRYGRGTLNGGDVRRIVECKLKDGNSINAKLSKVTR